MSKFQFNETGLSARQSIFDGTSAFGDGENGAPSVDPVEAFEQWMRNRKDPRGNRKFTDAKIRKRIEAFRGCRKIFRDAKICDVPLELVDDPDVLQQFESTFLSCPEYRRQTEKFRNRLMAAFHVYVAYRNDTKASAKPEGRLLPLGDDFQEYADALPVRYRIGDADERRVESWADLLVQIVETELARENPVLRAFYNVPLIPSLQPFFMKKRLSSVECRLLSNGCWVNVDWSTPLIIQSVATFCRSCGYDDENIRIWIREQNDSSAEVESEQDFTEESDGSSDSELTRLDRTGDDLSDSEPTDDNTVDAGELILDETPFGESFSDEQQPEWTGTSDEETQSEGEFAWIDDEEVEEEADNDESDDESADESGVELELDDEEAEEIRPEEEFAEIDDVDSAGEPSGNKTFPEPDDEHAAEVDWDVELNLDSENYRDFAETVPDACYIGGRLVTSRKGGKPVIPEEWKFVLLSIVNHEIGQKKPEIELLKKQSLKATRKSEFFFIGYDTASDPYRRVNNGFKIFLGYDTPQMLEVIVDFCRFVGYNDSEIILRGRKKTSVDRSRYDATEHPTRINYPKPGKCRVDVESFEEETWADLLYSIVEHEIEYPNGLSNNSIESLYDYPLESTQPGESFFLKKKPQGRICRYLHSNRRWIVLDYDDERLEQIIRDFCKVVGYEPADISIVYEENSSDQPVCESVNADAAESPTVPKTTPPNPNVDVSRPSSVGVPRPPKVGLIYCDFKNYGDFEGTVPCDCRIGNYRFPTYIKTWADLLFELVTIEKRKVMLDKLQELFSRPLLPSLGTEPFYLKERTGEPNCRPLTVTGHNYWINLNYDSPQLVENIVEFSNRAGYRRNEIVLCGRKIKGGGLASAGNRIWGQTDLTTPQVDVTDETPRQASRINVVSAARADVALPQEDVAKELPQTYFDSNLVYYKSENYDDFTGKYPTNCTIAGRTFHDDKWSSLFKSIVEYGVRHTKRDIAPLYRESLSGGLTAFFQRSKPAGNMNFQRLDSNGCWINVNFSASDTVKNIVRFCQRCGFDDSKIQITARKKNNQTPFHYESRGNSPGSLDTIQPSLFDVGNETTLAKFSSIVSLMREDRWKNGLNIRSQRDVGLFRDYAEERGVVLPSDNDQLVRELRRVGVVVGERVYRKSETFPQELRDITKEAFSFGNDVVYYESLYEKNEEWAHENSIWSVDLLAAFLEKYARGIAFRPRFMTRGGAKSEKEAVIGEVLHVWGEERAITVEELNRRLPMIPGERIKEFVTDDSRFLSVSKTEGRFFLLSRFKPSESTRRNILDFVETRCQEDGYATLADLPLGDLDYEYHELPRFALFNALEKTVLSPRFVVEKKIITRSGESFDLIKLLKREFSKQDSVLLDDALTRIDELAEYLGGQREIAFNTLYETMVRVEKDRFVADRFVSFEVDEIDQLLSEFIQDGFCAVRDIVAFHRLPYCGQTWNSFLLESYCFRFSRKYRLFVRHFNDKNAGVVAERGRFKEGESYENILAVALARSDVELTSEKAGEYLFTSGYAAKSQYKGLDEIVKKAAKLREQG